MGFNSAFKGLIESDFMHYGIILSLYLCSLVFYEGGPISFASTQIENEQEKIF